jgi:zinc/manganese transport system substrate-binding protein
MKKLILNLFIITGLFTANANCEEKLKIVSTLSTFADIAKKIGDDFVETASIASPKFNPHFIEPKPSDVLRLKRADLFIHSGLDLEAWRDPLLNASGRADFRQGGSAQLGLSTGLRILEIPDKTVSRSEGDIHLMGNPHYWLNPENIRILSKTISEKLSELKPEQSAYFAKNLSEFQSELDKKSADWKARLSKFKGSEFIGYHNEWIYLMEYTGLVMKQFLEPKPGIPPTPKQLLFLESYIKEKNVKGIIQATFYSTEAADNLSEKTGTPVLKLVQNVGETADVPDYFSMMEYNIKQLEGALNHG